MNKTFVRGVALLLIPTMLSSSGGAYGLADLTAPAAVLNISIPSHYGTITQSFAAPTRNPWPTVVLIQDLHGNLGVQRHIADILKYLAHRLSPSLTVASNMTVLVEGAAGPFDETIFRSLKSRWVQKEVLSRLIAERKLTGAEVAAIESDRPLHLWGIDDKALYLKNLQAFYRASLKSPVPTPKNPVWKNYYAIAHARDIPLALNALSHLDLLKRTANPPALVSMVTGGYHTKGLTRILEANGISYVVVTPAVDNLGEERAYTTLMQELARESRLQNLVALLRTVADVKHSFIPEATTEFQAEVPPTISDAAAHKPFWARVWEFIVNPIPVIQNWMAQGRERLRTPNRKLPPGEGLKDKPRTTQPTNIKPRPTKPSPARKALTWINQHLRWTEIPVLVPALAGDGFSNSGHRIRIPVGIMFRIGGEEMGGGPVGPGSAGGPAVIEPGILTRVGGLFGNKTIGDVVLNVEQVIADITRTVRPMIAPVLAARRAFLNSPLKAREKYAFPWTQKFKDADGNERTFHEIVQGLIDNFQGNKTDLAWRLNEEVPIPDDADPLLNPGLEITGPKALDMLINQINGAPLISSMMPDDEDASLAWQKLAAALDQIPAAFQGMANLKAILTGEYDHKPYVTTKKGQKREYTIKTLRGQRPAVFSRAPGIHLQSPHVLVDGAPAPQIALSYVIHALNNHGSLTKDGSGVYYYQPKVQTPEEALVIETLIRGIETLAGLKLGSIKIKALYEEGRAGLTLPAIMWVWRHRLIGTNVGRWDYLGSLLEMWKDEVVFPDPQSIGMTDSRLMTYQRVNVLWNLMTGGVPIGGMAAVMPYPPNDPYGRARWNLKAYRQMKLDKLRERLIGLVFVPNEPLADGRQPSLVEALELKRQGKGRFYDMYRQSWVATPDEKYVAAGAIPLRAAINELQAMIDAPVEMVTIEGTNQKVPTVASGLTDGEKQAWQKLGLLNAEGQIKPWLLRKDKMKTPEELFSAEFWGGKDLWSSLYEPPAMNKPGEDDPAKGHITIERIQNAFFQAAQYGFQILNGNYAAAIDDYEAFPGDTATGFRRFMNDLATYRIYTVFLWTVFQHPAQITKDGWLKAPKLTENGVIPGENAVFLKAGEKMTPEIFAQLWDLHNQWTAAFFADFDRLAATRLVDKFYFKVLGHEDLRILAVQKVLSKAYAKGPFKEISLDETTHQVAAALGQRNYDVEKMKLAIASEAPSFDRSQAPVIMDVLKRQFMSSDFLQHSPRVLFVLAETPEAKRAEITDAMFSPTRDAVKAKVDSGEWSQEALDAYDYVHDIYPEEETTRVKPSPAGGGSFSGSPDSAIRHALSEAQLAVDQGKFDKAENMLGALYSGLEGSINRRGSMTAEQYLTRFTSRVESITGYAGNADFPVQDVPHTLNVIVDLIKKLPDGVNLLRTLGIASEALGLLSVARDSRGSVPTPTIFVTMSNELATFTSSQPRIELHGSNEAELRAYLAHHYYELDRHLRSNIVFRQANGSAIASGQIFSGGEEIKIVDTADRIPSPFAKPAQIKSKPPLGIPRLFRKIITVVIMFLTLDAFIPQFKETPEDIAKNPSRIEMVYKGLSNWSHTNWLRPRNLDDVQNVSVRNWIQQMQVFTGAENLRFVDELDDEALIDEAVKAGELVRTADGGFYARSHPDDTARSVSRTSVATHDSNDRGQDNYSNWQDSNEKKEVVEAKIKNSMQGKTMYVIPYLLGPVGSPHSQVGFQVTDSRYVAISMIRMAKVGQVAWSALGKSSEFVKGVHSTGDLDAIHKARLSAKNDTRDFVAFADEGLILSYGSAYGGNALLTKKFHALRLASYAARNQGWLAEHMLILGVEDLQTGEVRYVTAAFPSQSGKSNTAMMLPPDILGKRYRVWTVGDDIAWMFIGRDGQLHAFNSENGIFGVAPDTNYQTNPNAMRSIDYGSRTIYTNVSLNPVTREVWWEGKEKTPDGKIKYPSLEGDGQFWEDWKGNKIINRPAEDRFNEDKPWAETNSRYTTAMKNVPSWAGHSKNPRIQMDMAHPAGVPISAILWGGRMDDREPLIRQLRNFYDGIYDGLMLGVHPSKKTASATEAAQKKMNEDPMAMRPFFSYGVADYAQHWVGVMEKLNSPANKLKRAYISIITGRKAVMPSFFHVNWFRKGADGKIIWPGYGENLRALLWALARSKGEADGRESFAGITPTPSDLNVEGLNLTPEQLDEVLNIDIREWVKDDEVGRRTQYIDKVIGPLHIELQNSHEEFITGYEFAQVEQRPFSTLNATPPKEFHELPLKARLKALSLHERAHAFIARLLRLPVVGVKRVVDESTGKKNPAIAFNAAHPMEQARASLFAGIQPPTIFGRIKLIGYLLRHMLATVSAPAVSWIASGVSQDEYAVQAHRHLARGSSDLTLNLTDTPTDLAQALDDFNGILQLLGVDMSAALFRAIYSPALPGKGAKKAAELPMTQAMKEEAAQLDKEWKTNPMWEHVKRLYNSELVVKLRNSPGLREEYAWAKKTALKLRQWMKEDFDKKENIIYFGVMSGQEAVDAVRAAHKAGKKAVLYVSGWNTAASGNVNDMRFPDLALWDAETLVHRIQDIINALKDEEIRDRSIDWQVPIVADIETGRGRANEVYLLARRVIKAGAAAIHIENQDIKKCGHMSFMTLCSTTLQKERLGAARLAADVLDVPTVIINRLDTLRAEAIRDDIAPVDQPHFAAHYVKAGDTLNGETIEIRNKALWTSSNGFLRIKDFAFNAGNIFNGQEIKADIIGYEEDADHKPNHDKPLFGPRYIGSDSKKTYFFNTDLAVKREFRDQAGILWHDGGMRTSDGFWFFDGGFNAAIDQMEETIDYADAGWFETGSPDPVEAKALADKIHEKRPWVPFKYNLSGNFNYQLYSDEYLVKFERVLAESGWVLTFNTIINWWLRRGSMLEFANEFYSEHPVLALKHAQMKAQAAAKKVGIEIRPQDDTGSYIYDAIAGAFSDIAAGNAAGYSTELQFAGDKRAGAQYLSEMLGIRLNLSGISDGERLKELRNLSTDLEESFKFNREVDTKDLNAVRTALHRLSYPFLANATWGPERKTTYKAYANRMLELVDVLPSDSIYAPFKAFILGRLLLGAVQMQDTEAYNSLNNKLGDVLKIANANDKWTVWANVHRLLYYAATGQKPAYESLRGTVLDTASKLTGDDAAWAYVQMVVAIALAKDQETYSNLKSQGIFTQIMNMTSDSRPAWGWSWMQFAAAVMKDRETYNAFTLKVQGRLPVLVSHINENAMTQAIGLLAREHAVEAGLSSGTQSIWSRANALLRLAVLPGLSRHEHTHIQDAIRLGLLRPEEMPFRARLKAYFTGVTPVSLVGPSVWNAQRANLNSAWMWALPVLAIFSLNHWGGQVPLLFALVPAWFAISNFIVGITEHLPKLGFFANYEESDARRAGLVALESDGVVGTKGFEFLTRQAIQKLTSAVLNPVLASPVLKYGLLGVTTALVIIALSHLSPIKAATTVLAGVVMIPPGLFTRIVAAVVGIVNKPATARIRDVGPVRVLTDA